MENFIFDKRGKSNDSCSNASPQPGGRDIHRLAVFRYRAAGDLEAFAVEEHGEVAVGKRFLFVFVLDLGFYQVHDGL